MARAGTSRFSASAVGVWRGVVSALLLLLGLLAGCRDEAPGLDEDSGVPANDAGVITGPPQWAMLGANQRRNHRSEHVGPRQGQHTTIDLSAMTGWRYSTVTVEAVGPQGTLYLHVGGPDYNGLLVSLQPDGTVGWTLDAHSWPFYGGAALDREGRLFFEGRRVVDDSDPMNPLFHIFFALDTTGRALWGWGPDELLTIAPSVFRSAPLWDEEGNVYVVLRQYVSEPDAFRLTSFGPQGELRWQGSRPVDCGFVGVAPVLGADGTLYVHTNEDPEGVYALTLEGQEQWFMPDPTDGLLGMAGGDDGTLYVLVESDQPELRAIDVEAETCWTLPLPRRSWASPIGPPGLAIAPGGTLHVGLELENDPMDPDLLAVGRIYAIAPNGVEKWSCDTEGRFLGDLAVDAEGAVYTVLATSQTTRVLGLDADGNELLDVDLGPEFDSSSWSEFHLPLVIAAGNRLYLGEPTTGRLHVISP